MAQQHIGIVGSGLIGRSWAMLFAAQGYEVLMYDSEPAQVQSALDEILKQLNHLKSLDLLRGKLSVQEQHALVKPAASLQECVANAKYVQECIPENLEWKKKLFHEMDRSVPEGCRTILASSTSSMPPSTFSSDIQNKGRVIVAHPTNPPFYCPLTEVCPAPYTESWVTQTTLDLMRQIGQVPVLLKKEILGFALNRIQYSIMNEVWRLVQDDAISAEDIDKVMTEGLGMRYAFCGPFETIHLNAEGTQSYTERYGDMIYGISQTFGPAPKMEGPTREKIVSEMEEKIPLDQLGEFRKRRDTKLSALAKLKKDL